MATSTGRTVRVEVESDQSNSCIRRLRSCWHRTVTGMTESGIGPGAKSHYLDPRSSERGPCYSLTRLLMFVFTGLFFILGIVVLAVGIAVHTDADFRAAVSDHTPGANVGAGLFIFVGLVMVLTGFVGCLGAVRESRCLLFSFFLVLFFVFILLVACGIWADASKLKMRASIAARLEAGVRNYYSDTGSRQMMDSIQTRFRCCGSIEGALDYQKQQRPLLVGAGVPASCGARRSQAEGCYFSIVQQLDAQMTKIAAVGVTIALVMIIGMVLSLTLCWHVMEAP